MTKDTKENVKYTGLLLIVLFIALFLNWLIIANEWWFLLAL